MSGTAIWITGLPGSGKSAVADEIKKIHPDFIILRMDELREIVTPEPSYSDTERDIVYRSVVFIAKAFTEAGHNVIIDATGNMRKWRELARRLIHNYIEVYLKCPLELCVSREKARKDTRGAPKDIYHKGRRGWPVPGVNAAYEEPVNPEVAIETDRATVKDAAETVIDFLFRSKIGR